MARRAAQCRYDPRIAVLGRAEIRGTLHCGGGPIREGNLRGHRWFDWSVALDRSGAVAPVGYYLVPDYGLALPDLRPFGPFRFIACPLYNGLKS